MSFETCYRESFSIIELAASSWNQLLQTHTLNLTCPGQEEDFLPHVFGLNINHDSVLVAQTMDALSNALDRLAAMQSSKGNSNRHSEIAANHTSALLARIRFRKLWLQVLLM